MKLSDYMEEVVKECSDLECKHYPDYYNVVNKEGKMIISGSGDCNYGEWNKRWVRKNIQEFNNVHLMDKIDVQELFPDPLDFVKFYKKVCKEIKK